MPKSGETSKTKCARHCASHEFVIAASALQHMLKGGCHRPTMSDANECLVGITLSNTSHQLAFSMLIKRGTYFIQQQDTARTKQSSGNSYALRLSFTQSATTFVQHGVNALRQLMDKIGTCRVEHIIQLLRCGLWIGQQQIITYGAAHERITLRHKDKESAG